MEYDIDFKTSSSHDEIRKYRWTISDFSRIPLSEEVYLPDFTSIKDYYWRGSILKHADKTKFILEFLKVNLDSSTFSVSVKISDVNNKKICDYTNRIPNGSSLFVEFCDNITQDLPDDTLVIVWEITTKNKTDTVVVGQK